MRGLVAVGALLLVGVAGCADDDTSATSAGPEPAGCEDDPRAMTYSADMRAAGARYQVALVAADPAPPTRGNNSWTVRVLDADDVAVDDVTTMAVRPWMPDHGHGSSAHPVVTMQGDGTETITPLYFSLTGIWEVTLTPETPEGSDSVVFTFCVGG